MSEGIPREHAVEVREHLRHPDMPVKNAKQVM